MVAWTRLIVLGMLATAVATACQEQPPGRPNVLLYMTDTLRADALGSYGNDVVDTPTLDRFAALGTQIDEARAASAWTRASIASLLTGLHPDAHGAESRGSKLSADLPILSEIFARHGYEVGAIVTNPNVGSAFGFARGWHSFLELYERRDPGPVSPSEAVAKADEVSDRAIEWIDRGSEPFFLFVLSIDPHDPYQPPQAFDRYGGSYRGQVDGRLAALRGQILSPADRERVRSLYLGEVAYNDAALGRLLDHLDRRGLRDETILVFTSDHGEEFWEHGGVGHGNSLYEESLRIPLIFGAPFSERISRNLAGPAQTVDILPTLLELAGLPVPEGLDGRSLLETDAGPARTSYSRLRLGRRNATALVRPPWKLIVDEPGERELLFDLTDDPGEARDLRASHPEVARALRAEIDGLRERNESRRAAAGAGADEAEFDELPIGTRQALEALGYAEPKRAPAR